jgi:hypothetical protein
MGLPGFPESSLPNSLWIGQTPVRRALDGEEFRRYHFQSIIVQNTATDRCTRPRSPSALGLVGRDRSVGELRSHVSKKA